MNKKIAGQKGIAPIIILIIVAVLAAGGFGVYKIKQNAAKKEVEEKARMEMEERERAAMEQSMNMAKVTVHPQNNSRESGLATIIEVQGKARVILNLTGAPSATSQPAHVHFGSCANLGGVKYPLTNISRGASQTDLPVSLKELFNEPFAINVHKSATAANIYVACGDTTSMEKMMSANPEKDAMMNASGSMMKKDESAMMEKSGAMMTETKVFNVTGQNFSFSVKEIRVKKGDKVRVNFTSGGGFHDWVLDKYSVRTERVNTGGKSSVEFTADKAGTFEYYCSVGSHRQMGMVGKLIVE